MSVLIAIQTICAVMQSQIIVIQRTPVTITNNINFYDLLCQIIITEVTCHGR